MQPLLVLTLTCRSDLVEAFARRIRGVQQVMGQVRVRLAEELLVELFDLRIVVGLTHSLALIL